MVHHLTLGIRTTGCTAGVCTSVVDTSVGLRTVLVLPAANEAHLVETDVAQETVIVHPAGHWREVRLDQYSDDIKRILTHAESLQTSFVESTVLV